MTLWLFPLFILVSMPLKIVTGINWFAKWVGIDLLWAIAAGIVMGIVVAKAIVLAR